MTLVRNHTCSFNDHPFVGKGVSLYASVGSVVVYRNIRLHGGGRRRRRRGGWIKGSGGNVDYGSGVNKTARRDSVADPGVSIAWAIPAAFASQTVSFDVRQWENDVENENDNTRFVTVELDANRDEVSAINATAEVIAQEQRQGGIVRIRIAVYERLDGTQPILVRLAATAGPSSPVDATGTYYAGQRVIEVDTPALLDSSAYTYDITLENGAITKTVVSGLSVQADATGPPVPLCVTAATH